MSEKAGFKIGDRVYPFPEKFRMGDTILVHELTRLEFDDFSERLDAMQATGGAAASPDPLVMIGLVGIALWQGNPRWSLDRAVRETQLIDFSDFETVGDDGPPAIAAEAAKDSAVTSDESTTTDTPTG